MARTTRAQRWRAALAVYGDRRMAAILVLGFSSGLPLALTGATLATWLATQGVSKTAIGLFALVGLPYTLKFLWAPAIDGLRLPLLTRWLGRRRGWMILTQLCLMAAILVLGTTDPAINPLPTALAALAVAFLSASQDIVIDAWRVEILAESEQGAGAAAIQIGYRGGMLASGAGALYIAGGASWELAYIVMAVLMVVGMTAILLSQEPGARRVDTPDTAQKIGFVAWLGDYVIAPFADFMARPGWLAILGFILLYKFGDAVAGVMTGPFYIETGFTLAEIASVTKVFGIAATILGAIAGGVAVARWGIVPALIGCGVAQAASNLMFAAQAAVGHDIGFLALTIAIENLSGGAGTAAFVAYLSSLCHVAFTATQYALLSSFAAVGRTVLASSGGWMADRLDWVTFFSVSAIAALPGLFLLAWMVRRWPVQEKASHQ